MAEQEAPAETADPEECVAAGLADLGSTEVPEAMVVHQEWDLVVVVAAEVAVAEMGSVAEEVVE